MIVQLVNRIRYIKYFIFKDLSKRHRHYNYVKALECIEHPNPQYRCICLNLPKYNNFGERVVLDYPEILKHKPLFVSIGSNWWLYDEEGKNRRIKILKQAIKETM